MLVAVNIDALRTLFENVYFWVRKIVLGKRQVSQIALGKANCFLGGFRSSGALQPPSAGMVGF